MKTAPLLDSPERNSAAWIKVKEYLDSRLETLREQNDTSKSIEATEKLRGRIAEIKLLMAEVEPLPSPVAEDEEHLC